MLYEGGGKDEIIGFVDLQLGYIDLFQAIGIGKTVGPSHVLLYRRQDSTKRNIQAGVFLRHGRTKDQAT